MKKIILLVLPVILNQLPESFLTGNLLAQTWHPLGSGVSINGNWGDIYVIREINNELYIGGSFTEINGYPANSIVKFNGNIFDSLGGGMPQLCFNGGVKTLEIYNGNIYMGGDFECVDWLPNTKNLAKWDGVEWSSVTGSNNAGAPRALQYKDDLYIGGGFFSGYGVNGKGIVKYNGSVFDNMKGGIDGPWWPSVWTMAVYNDELIIGGQFNRAGNKVGYNNIARWNGTDWDSLGGGVNNWVASMVVDTVNNILYISGAFYADSLKWVAGWDGTNWLPVGSPPMGFNALAIFNGELYGGGESQTSDTFLMGYNGAQWSKVPGPNGWVTNLTVYKGNLYVGGYFDKIDTMTVNHIACYGNSCPFTIGVKEFQVESSRFKIYPNPLKKELTVEIVGANEKAHEEKYFVSIKNTQGKQVFDKPFGKKIVINTSKLPKGLYLVEVCNAAGEECETRKVMVE
ncbi:MAG: T9SS type A sorting domain-containing protein [Bacteroidetes bacterium]|nr:T9SS type A sorting domain-containing protein [Bacteroidota bacterium]